MSKIKANGYTSKKDKGDLNNNYNALLITSEEQHNILSYFAKFLIEDNKVVKRSLWNSELKKDLLEIMCKKTLSDPKYVEQSGIFSIGENKEVTRKKSTLPDTQSAYVIGDSVLINMSFYTEGKTSEIKKTCNKELHGEILKLSKWWSDKKSNLLSTFENKLKTYLKDEQALEVSVTGKKDKEKLLELNPLQSLFRQMFGKDVLNSTVKPNKNALNLKMFNNTAEGYDAEKFDEIFFRAFQEYAESTNNDLALQSISEKDIIKYK